MQTRPVRIRIPPEAITQVLGLYRQGLYLQAYEATKSQGPLRAWDGPAEMVCAGRVAAALGAPRLGAALHTLAARRYPDDPLAACYGTQVLLDRRGPFAARLEIRRRGDLANAPPGLRSEWLTLRARVSSAFRDFEAALADLDAATNLAPERPWIEVARCWVLERADQREEALAAAQRALTLRPYYRPAVQAAADILIQLGRDAEAAQLLAEADGRLECAWLASQLAAIELERGNHAAAADLLDRFEARSPLLETKGAQWLAARRADLACLAGDLPRAIEQARRAGDRFHARLAERLSAAAPDARRVELPVEFVRQNHSTCAPATLTAISRYWRMSAEHLQVAEEICHDGTPDHAERRWAETHGFLAREFRVTWESAVALLDRGVPFTFTTVLPDSAHLQAVIGYDARGGILLLRDPSLHNKTELTAPEGLEIFRASGPRGMAMVPRERAALLEGLQLPDADLFDRFTAFRRALADHDRERAQALVAELAAAAPEHRLSLAASRDLARYDHRLHDALAAVRRLRLLYSDDTGLLLEEAWLLDAVDARRERVALLEAACARPGAHPLVRLYAAQAWSEDARLDERSAAMFGRVLRERPTMAAALAGLAGLHWRAGRFDEALPLYRSAACVDELEEGPGYEYFEKARSRGRTEEALGFLRERFRRHGARSSEPARTLVRALDELDRHEESASTLAEALQRRPEDGELKLFAAWSAAHAGRFDQARAFLDAARGRCRDDEWRRAKAHLAVLTGESAEALNLLRGLAAEFPLRLAIQERFLEFLAGQEGPQAVLAHLRRLVDRFPNHFGIARLLYDHLGREDAEASLTLLRRLVELDPADAWSRTVLAERLAERLQLEEAERHIAEAVRIAPDRAPVHAVRADLLERRGRIAEARDACRTSLQCDVEHEWPMHAWIRLCESPEQRQQALDWVRSEIERQARCAEAVARWSGIAAQFLTGEEVVAGLRRLHAARPEVWSTGCALAHRLAVNGALEEAAKIAADGCERFPLVPAVWLEAAKVHELRRDPESEASALQRALAINPSWATAARRLASLQERQEKLEAARETLERSLRRAPRSIGTYELLADVLWKLGLRPAALERLEAAIRLAPEAETSWRRLREYCAEAKEPDRPCRLARELCARNPGDATAWVVLARSLPEGAGDAEALEALARALALEPRRVEAHDWRARILARTGRWDEALAACRPSAFGVRPPADLRARAAWIEARRGNVDAAIAGMRLVLHDASSLYWGWMALLGWLDTTKRKAEYVEVARIVADRWPLDPAALNHLGDALLRQGDRAGARETWTKATRLDPPATFAAERLFDLWMEDGQVDEAEALLQRLPARERDAYVAVRELRLARIRGRKNDALALLRELCRASSANAWPLETAVQELADQGWGRDATVILEEAVERDDAHPQVGEEWVCRCQVEGRVGTCAERIARMRPGAPALRSAVMEALHELATHQWKSEALWRAIRVHQTLFAKDAEAWGQLGYALLETEQSGLIIDLLQDWEKRADVRPWMLLNVAVAYRNADRPREAARVSQRALDLPVDQPASAKHAVWLALDAALAGSPQGAERLLGKAKDLPGDTYYGFLHALTRALTDVTSAPPEEVTARIVGARERIDTCAREYPSFRRNRVLLKHYLEVIRRIANISGDWGDWWWWLRTMAQF